MDFTSYENKIPQIFLTGLISAFDTLSVWAKFAVARRVIIDFFWGPVYGRRVQKVCSENPGSTIVVLIQKSEISSSKDSIQPSNPNFEADLAKWFLYMRRFVETDRALSILLYSPPLRYKARTRYIFQGWGCSAVPG